MKQVVLLSLLFSVLPLSKNKRDTDVVPPVAFIFKATIGNPFLGPPKAISAIYTSQLKQSAASAMAESNQAYASFFS